MIAAMNGAEVIGVEQNHAAVRDAVANAKRNQLRNIHFVEDDAGKFMQRMAAEQQTCDVLFMDPPRAGASPAFLRSVGKLAVRRVVYISCGIETLARDLQILQKEGYHTLSIQPVDMFPHTTGIEHVCLLEHKQRAKTGSRSFAADTEKKQRR